MTYIETKLSTKIGGKVKQKYKFREPELKLDKRLGITEEVYLILKDQRKQQKKSMARIANDLLIEKYGDQNVV